MNHPKLLFPLYHPIFTQRDIADPCALREDVKEWCDASSMLVAVDYDWQWSEDKPAALRMVSAVAFRSEKDMMVFKMRWWND